MQLIPGIGFWRRDAITAAPNSTKLLQDLVSAEAARFAESDPRDLGLFEPRRNLRKIGRRDVELEIDRVKTSRSGGVEAHCNFSARQVEGVDFTLISALRSEPDLLRGADFSQANLLNCTFGPVMLPSRSQNIEIPIDHWSGTPAIDLTDAIFTGAHIYASNFSGVNLSRADFQKAHIFLSRFDLVYTAGDSSWVRASFDDSRIENSYFRGAQLRGSFLRADIFKTDFTPGDLPPFDVKKADSRLSRLGAPASVRLEVHKDAFYELIAAKRDELDKFDESTQRIWRGVIAAVEGLASGDALEIPLRNLIRTRLDQSIFEDAFIFSCAFRAVRMDRRVKLDRAIMLRSDFRPARVEDLPWQHAIITVLLRKIAERISLEDFNAVGSSLRSLLRQLAERIEDTAIVVTHEPGFDNPAGQIVSRMADASFDEVIAKDIHFNSARALRIQFGDALLADCYFEETDLRESTLDYGLFRRTSFDRADFSGGSMIGAHFDGDLVDSQRALSIDRKAEWFNSRLQAVRDEIEANRNRIQKLGSGADDELLSDDTVAETGDYGPDGQQPGTADDSDSDVRKVRRAFELYHLRKDSLREALSEGASFFKFLQSDVDSETVGAPSYDELAADGCSFHDALLVGVNASEALFIGCTLENAKFDGGKFGRTEKCTASNFDSAFLRGASFYNAVLDNVSFSGAVLTGMAGLDRAHALQGASFFESRGLRGTEFAGADLTGVTLPNDLRGFGGVLNSVTELTRQARILFATLMFVCAYSILSIVNINSDAGDEGRATVSLADPRAEAALENAGRPTNPDLRERPSPGGESASVGLPLDGAIPVQSSQQVASFKLPVIGVEVSRPYFYLATPFIIVAFYAMFQLKFARIWLESKWLPYRFPDSRLIDRHVFPWIFASLLSGSLKRHANLRRDAKSSAKHTFTEKIISRFEQFLAYVLGWLAVPFTVGIMAQQQLRLKNGERIGELPEILQFGGVDVFNTTAIALIVSVAIALMSSLQFIYSPSSHRPAPSARESETSGASRSSPSTTRSRIRNWLRAITEPIRNAWRRLRMALYAAASVFFAAFATISLVSLPGALDAAAESGVRGPIARIGLSVTDILGFAVYEMSPAELHAKSPSGDFSSRDVNYLSASSAHFAGADFSTSRLTRVRMSGANLRAVQFTDAEIILGDFTNADLTDASFHGARLLNTDFTGAVGADAAAFTGACANAATKLPPGIAPLRACPTLMSSARTKLQEPESDPPF